MIRDFWVKNYLSIRDKQELSFLAKGPASELVTEITDGVFLYKLGILYGSNASGKSNMLIAMDEIFHILIQPRHDATKGVSGCIPFVLTKDEPVEMHVSFYANGIRYDYDVAFNEKHILKEVLNYYPNKSKALFYERTFVGENIQADIKFGQKLGLQPKTQDSIRDYTLNNHSVLSVCRKNALTEDIAPFRELHSWIMGNYHDIDGDEEKGVVDTLKEAYLIPQKRKFYNTMLQKADLNILEYRPVVEDRHIPAEFRERILNENIPEKVKESLLKPTADTM